MEKRSLFQNIFGKKEQQVVTNGTYKLLNSYSSSYTRLSANIYDNNIARECIDCIATNAAKLLPKHINTENGKQVRGDINYLLSRQPNPFMTSYDFIYKLVSILFTTNNAFVYIAKDRNAKITGFYPVMAANYSLLEDKQGNPLIQFQFINGKTYTLPYTDLIHLRRFFNRNDIYGEDNSVILNNIETVQVADDGIKNSIKLTNNIRGIIHYENAMLKESDLKKNRDNFVKDYLSLSDQSGIATLDAKAKFETIKLEPVLLDKDQLESVKGNIYEYFRLNKNILTSKYSAEEWSSFYESIIEPLSIQLGLAFTTKIFSRKSNNAIVFSASRVQNASFGDKITLIKEAGSLGLLTKNEAREIIDLPALDGEEGDKIIQSLNNIDSSIANEYQGGKNE